MIYFICSKKWLLSHGKLNERAMKQPNTFTTSMEEKKNLNQKPTKHPIQKKIGLFAGPLAFVMIILLPQFGSLTIEAQKVVAAATWMLIWWITEAVNISVTSLLPLVLFPLLTIDGLSINEAAAPYGSKIVFLFMGGFVVAIAMEKWKLHLRIALKIVSLTGTNANGIILGFMLATAFLSMWISNTATTVMMLPIASSVLVLLANNQEVDDKKIKRFSLVMMLAIAYAANIGGIATIIGTPPNTVFAAFMSDQLNYQVDFITWMGVGVPFSAIMLFVTFFMLTRVLYPHGLKKFEGAENIIRSEQAKLGKMSKAEERVLAVFICTALAWMFRKYINIILPGLTDTGIAMAAAISLFLIPLKFNQGKFILVWEDMKKLPWGILLLFGGGLSLAKAMSETGIIDIIGGYISNNSNLGYIIIIAILTTTVLFMTELMSNVALITIFLPVIAGITQGLGEDPLLMAIPATIASSCAFMLPMATPPNAIVFASGKVKVAEMAKAGLWLNIIAIVFTVILAQFFIGWIFGIG